MVNFLVIIIIVLVALLFNENRKTKVISLKLQNILKDNSRERIKIKNLSKREKELTRNINCLLDKYESVYVDSKNYKEKNKKIIADISHDIRTPLTAIMGYIDFLRDESLTEDKKLKYIDIIYERGIALKELMEEFFEMAKLESNDEIINIEKVNLSEIIRQNIITYISEINEREIVPEINIGEDEIWVLGERRALNRVISNLISNSLRYGYEGKVIGIEVKEFEKTIEMVIWDRGRGIDKNEISSVFERLYTKEKSRNRKVQGSGLGLAIAKKLVEKMNGTIELTSIPYFKTEFIVTLEKVI